MIFNKYIRALEIFYIFIWPRLSFVCKLLSFSLGFLKLTLSIYDEEQPNDSKLFNKRVTRNDSTFSRCTYSDTGVDKIFLIACAPNIPENYDNCSIFLEKCQLNRINHTYAVDCKVR